MPGEPKQPIDRSRHDHADRAEELLSRAASTDQSMPGFALAQCLATEAVAHALLAGLPGEVAEP